jgi:hypothetical protein
MKKTIKQMKINSIKLTNLKMTNQNKIYLKNKKVKLPKLFLNLTLKDYKKLKLRKSKSEWKKNKIFGSIHSFSPFSAFYSPTPVKYSTPILLKHFSPLFHSLFKESLLYLDSKSPKKYITKVAKPKSLFKSTSIYSFSGSM